MTGDTRQGSRESDSSLTSCSPPGSITRCRCPTRAGRTSWRWCGSCRSSWGSSGRGAWRRRSTCGMREWGQGTRKGLGVPVSQGEEGTPRPPPGIPPRLWKALEEKRAAESRHQREYRQLAAEVSWEGGSCSGGGQGLPDAQ